MCEAGWDRVEKINIYFPGRESSPNSSRPARIIVAALIDISRQFLNVT
jgi:hypothetical protein